MSFLKYPQPSSRTALRGPRMVGPKIRQMCGRCCVDQAGAVIVKGRTGHLGGPAGNGIDGGQGLEQRVLAGEGLFLLQDVQLLIGLGDDPFPDRGGNLFELCPQVQCIEQRDVEEPHGAALIAAALAFHAVLSGRFAEALAGHFEELAILFNDTVHGRISLSWCRK